MEMVVVFFGCFLYKDNIIIPIWYPGRQVDFVRSLLSDALSLISRQGIFLIFVVVRLCVSVYLFSLFFSITYVQTKRLMRNSNTET